MDFIQEEILMKLTNVLTFANINAILPNWPDVGGISLKFPRCCQSVYISVELLSGKKAAREGMGIPFDILYVFFS